MVNSTFIPSWKKHEKELTSDNSDGSAFIDTRKREVLTSEQARSWEEGRKKELAAAKPEYIRKRNQKEKDKLNHTLNTLLDGGDYEEEVIPSPGFILLKLDEVPNQMGDIYLPISNEDAPNTGIVIEVGEDKDNKFAHKKGDRVIIRKFSANLHVNIKGVRFYFLMFSDVLGRFK